MHVWKRCVFVCVYCLCCVQDISIEMLEEQVSEERYMDLNEEEDVRI